MRGVFITGTDTGIGKTFLTVQLLRLLRARGLRCAGFKPICCGDRRDAELLLAASSAGFSLDQVNPIWLRTPASPFTAARIEEVTIDPEQLKSAYFALAQNCDFVVVEGVGGWRVPITDNYFVSDLAGSLGLPVLIVAANRLGCLNHILLTTQSVIALGLPVAAVAMNQIERKLDVASATNAEVLAQLISIPILNFPPDGATTLPPEWAAVLLPSSSSCDGV